MPLGLHNIHTSAHRALAEREDAQEGQAGSGPSCIPASEAASTRPSDRIGEWRVCQRPECARLFFLPVRRVRHGKGQFCSRPCASRANAAICFQRHPQRGALNFNYRGGLSGNKRTYVNRFRAKHPEKARAHDAVKNAIARGVLVKPLSCERCGCEPIEPLHAHHQDYARPLTVVFLCRPCHRQADAALRLASR